MSARFPSGPAALTLAVALLAAVPSHAVVVNIDASHGFTYDGGGSDPAPQPGQHINLIGAPVTLALDAGTWRVTNAAGLPGALFSAWSYNVGTSSWAWAFVAADDATRRVLFYAEAGGGSSAAAVAALPAVQNFRHEFTLAAPTTLVFTLRDYYVPDNAGGISIDVSPVPEPGPAALLAAGLALLGWRARRRRG
jgi:hypothetical protein